MRIDAHHHFIDYSAEQYQWMGAEHDLIKRSFLPEQFKAVLDKHHFDGSVVVQARQTLQETNWLIALAEQHDWIKAVVGWVDLCSPDVEEQLQALIRSSKLKGIRHVLQDEVDDRFMLRADFQRGIAQLASYGLTYDLLVVEKHLPYVIELLQRFPKQLFVIDHIAKPNIQACSIAQWSKQMQTIGSFPNVYCKLSGMVTEAHWNEWTEADFRPYLDAVFQAFGTDRLMIGSDWPVCTLSGDYTAVMDIVLHYIAELSQAEQDKILGGNCAKFYRIDR